MASTVKDFIKKNHESLLDWIDTCAVYSKFSQREINYILCKDLPGLLYMVNLGCIKINPWSSICKQLDQPDYAVLDLDPSDKNTFEEVIEVAQTVKGILGSAGIESYCKTSGSTGLHIYLPLGGKYSYEEGREFTKLLAYYVQQELPNLTTLTRNKKARKKKIYLDYLQNRRGQTLAAPYCVRPQPEAPVSIPLRWEEVIKGLKISDYTIQNVPIRLVEMGDIFQPVLTEIISIEKALENLER